MNAKDLLAQLAAAGAHVGTADGKLTVDAPAGTLTDEMKAAIREHKADLLALVRPCSQCGGTEFHHFPKAGRACLRCHPKDGSLPTQPSPGLTSWIERLRTTQAWLTSTSDELLEMNNAGVGSDLERRFTQTLDAWVDIENMIRLAYPAMGCIHEDGCPEDAPVNCQHCGAVVAVTA